MVRFDGMDWLAQPWQRESLLVVLGAGGLALLIGLNVAGLPLQLMSLLMLGYGAFLLPRARQPDARLYQPRGFATQILKWISAPQVEAAILLWVGWSFLVEPTQVSIFRLTDSLLLSQGLGVLFLLLGWRMATTLPRPTEYIALTSTRLLYTLLVVVDVLANSGPLIVVGVYVGSVLHGVVSMLVQWTLHEIADEVRQLERELQRVRAERGV